MQEYNNTQTNNIYTKSILTELINVYEYIHMKSKIKILDVHPSLPWICFSDFENNIYVFDMQYSKAIRAFNIQQHINEQTNIKDLKFFNTSDKKFINTYELNELKKVKGIPFNQRNNLVIITLEKYICFYSLLTQGFVRVIQLNEIENKIPLRCEVFNSSYLLILTSDSLIIWNITEWTYVKAINKTNVLRPVSNFLVVTMRSEEKYIAIANNNGGLFLVEIASRGINYFPLDMDKVFKK
jgi:hypothetical protein